MPWRSVQRGRHPPSHRPPADRCAYLRGNWPPRLEMIPGIGPIMASARAVAVTDSTPFRAGRHLAARDGLLAVVLAGME